MANKIFKDINYLHLNLLLIIFLVNFNVVHSHYANTRENLDPEETSDKILCRECGADLADSKHIINHLSPLARVKTNQTVFGRKGVEVQLLENPLGINFQLITVSNSKCYAVSDWQQDFSWYPGFSWKPCFCKQCKLHHGWLFEPKENTNLSSNLPTDKGFFALNLYGLLSENFANSLIVVPKSYLN